MITFTRGCIYTSQQQHPRHVRFQTNFCGRLGQLANAAYIRATSLQQQQRTRKFNPMHISSTPSIKKSLPACGTMLRHVAEGSRLTGNSMTCHWGTAWDTVRIPEGHWAPQGRLETLILAAISANWIRFYQFKDQNWKEWIHFRVFCYNQAMALISLVKHLKKVIEECPKIYATKHWTFR